jgi:hypothetical protein
MSSDLRDRARSLLSAPVGPADVALAFDESAASTTDLHVGGHDYFRRCSADIAADTSSVHVNQYGFRPGAIGERFATTPPRQGGRGLGGQADRRCSRSYRGRSGREFFARLRAGGIDVGARPKPNSKACAAAQFSRHAALLDAGVRILVHPAMRHTKAFVRDRSRS